MTHLGWVVASGGFWKKKNTVALADTVPAAAAGTGPVLIRTWRTSIGTGTVARSTSHASSFRWSITTLITKGMRCTICASGEAASSAAENGLPSKET